MNAFAETKLSLTKAQHFVRMTADTPPAPPHALSYISYILPPSSPRGKSWKSVRGGGRVIQNTPR